jgi:carboxypeptidase family protein
MVTIARRYVALLLVTFCGSCCAQEHSTLAGRVRSRNAALSQVTVRLLSENSNQILAATVTADDGSFGFADLPCGGSYTLAFSRAGWEARHIRLLQLRCDTTLQVKVVLYPASEPPCHRTPAQITEQSPWWGTQFGQLQLADLPNARNIWSLLQTQEPSTVTDRIDVGGLESGEPALFGAQGASWTENQYRLNGLNVTDPYQPGFPLLDPSLDDLAQFQVVTAAKPAADGDSGTNIMLVTPAPGPAWHGGARFFYSSNALQSDNSNARLARFHFPGPERINHLEDGSVQLGGKLPPALASLPFYTSFSTQQLDKTLGGFAAPIQTRIYRFLVDMTAYSRSSQKLDLSYSGQHVTDSREGAAPNVAPSATTRANRNFQQFQARWSKTTGSATVFSASTGLVNAVISSEIQNGVADVSTLDLPQMTLTGSAPLSRSGVRTSYQGQGQMQMLRTGPAGTQSLSLGMDWQRSDITNRWFAIQNFQAITAEGVAAEVTRWNTPARTKQHVQNVAEFAQDLWRPSHWLGISAGLRVDSSTGRAPGGGSAINWTTLQPRLGVVVPLWPRGFFLQGNWARYGHVLQGRYLDFGNPAALGGQVYRWADVNGDGQAQAQEIGPLLRVFGGPHSALASGIARPFTDEISFGLEQDLDAGFSAAIRFFRRDDHRLLALNNIGVTFSDYTPVIYHDPGNDGIFGTPDDQFLTLYNRLPSALGKDFLVLGNYGFHASYKGMEARLSKRLFRRWAFAASFTATRTLATTNPGNSVFEDDTGVIGTLNTDPNALIFAQGRTHFDRAFTGKISGYYSAPLGLHLGVVAAYYDGLPFGRLLFVNGFNQGPFFVRAQPVGHPGGFQTQLNATLDCRISRSFSLPRGVLSAYLDVFNLLNANSNTLESDLSGPAFLTRVPLAVEPPRTARVGLQWIF